MPPYQLTFDNQSPQDGTAAVYQHDLDISYSNAMSLAWFAKKAYTGTTVTFTWNIDYCFVWSQTGILRPGVQFVAGQTVDADPNQKNRIGIDCDPRAGAYHFILPPTEGQHGTLEIMCSNRVPSSMVSIGIGMSGFGTCVVQAGPNTIETFTPHPKYYIVFGQFQQGEVLNITEVASKSAKVNFPANVYRMKATLDSRNNWSVNPV